MLSFSLLLRSGRAFQSQVELRNSLLREGSSVYYKSLADIPGSQPLNTSSAFSIMVITLKVSLHYQYVPWDSRRETVLVPHFLKRGCKYFNLENKNDTISKRIQEDNFIIL